MRKKHIHSEIIKQWADGAEIEMFHNGAWATVSTSFPWFPDNASYRVKPGQKESTVILDVSGLANGVLTLHCEDGIIKSVDVHG